MTVFGIAGCMALLLFGFAIKDSVRDLVPRQYEKTFLYDAMAVAAGENVVEQYIISHRQHEKHRDCNA